MINIYIVLAILFTHWVADFVMQTHEQLIGKSKSNKILTEHILWYTGTFLVSFWLVLTFNYAVLDQTPSSLGWHSSILLFFPITFICHWITDYYASRLNSKLWAKGDVHNFFVSIGFDQFLHVAQLLLTYQLLK